MSRDRPKVVIDALNLRHGGGTIVMGRVAAALSRQGADVIVLSSQTRVEETASGAGVTVMHVPHGAGALRATLYRVRAFARLLRRFGATGVVSFNYRSPTSLPQVTYHINVIPHLPLAQRVRAVGILRAVLQAMLARAALRKNLANAFESRHLLQLARGSGPPETGDFIAYTGIDVPQGAEPRGEPPASQDVCLITSGAKHKDNDTAFRAFREFSKQRPNSRLHIFGMADDIRAGLSDEIQAYCDGNRAVVFRGYVCREELYETLTKAYALLTASRLESFYMVALEAMIVGCPVVAADISSVRESIGPAGSFFKVGDWQSAARNLETLADDAQWRAASRAGFQWAKEFDADRLADAFAKTTLEFLTGAGG